MPDVPVHAFGSKVYVGPKKHSLSQVVARADPEASVAPATNMPAIKTGRRKSLKCFEAIPGCAKDMLQ